METQTDHKDLDLPESQPQNLSSSQFAVVVNKFAELNQQLGVIKELKESVSELSKAVSFMNSQYEDQKKMLQGLQDEN